MSQINNNLQKINNKLKKYNTLENKNLNDEAVENKLNLIEEKTKLEKELISIKDKKEDIEYFAHMAKYYLIIMILITIYQKERI